MTVPHIMHSGYEGAPELPFQASATLAGLLDLAAHLLTAPWAVLCIAGFGSPGLMTTVGFDRHAGFGPDRVAEIGRELAALDGDLDAGPLVRPAAVSAGGGELGILAGLPVNGTNGERLG